MRAIATTYNGNKDNDRDIIIKIMARRNLMNRIIRFSKSADGDSKTTATEKYLYKICRAVIVGSAVCSLIFLMMRQA
jgi:hypothetical protein